MKKKLVSLALALVMVLSLVPVSAMAEGEEGGGAAPLAAVSAISTGGTVEGSAGTATTVTFGEGAVLYYADASEAGTGRLAGYHAGVKVLLPEGIDLTKVKYQKVDKWGYDDGKTEITEEHDTQQSNKTNAYWLTSDFEAARKDDKEGEFTIWVLAQPEWFGQYCDTAAGTLCYRYRFDWNGDNRWDQTILVKVEKTAILMKDGNAVWPLTEVTGAEGDYRDKVDDLTAAVAAAAASETATTVTVTAGGSDGAAAATLPADLFTAAAAADNNKLALTVEAGTEASPLNVTLDKGALDVVAGKASSAVTITAKDVTEDSSVEDKPEGAVAAYQVEVKVGDEPITEWTGSKITLTVPAPTDAEGEKIDVKDLLVYLDGDAQPTIRPVKDGDNSIKVTVPHLSVVAFAASSAAEIAFDSFKAEYDAAEKSGALNLPGVRVSTIMNAVVAYAEATEEQKTALADKYAQVQNITELKVIWPDTIPDYLNNLGFLAPFTKLVKLDVSGNAKLVEVNAVDLSKATLTHLDAHDCGLKVQSSEAGFINGISGVDKCGELVWLDIHGNADLDNIDPLAADVTKLATLDISGTKVATMNLPENVKTLTAKNVTTLTANDEMAPGVTAADFTGSVISLSSDNLPALTNKSFFDTLRALKTACGGTEKQFTLKDTDGAVLYFITAGDGLAIDQQVAKEGASVTVTDNSAAVPEGYSKKLTFKDAAGADIADVEATGTTSFTMPAKDVTVNVTTVLPEGQLAITAPESSENGTVTVAASAAAGDTVTITVAPGTGYMVGAITVMDANGKAVAVTKVSDTEYTFTMPGTPVTVAAAFKKEIKAKFTPSTGLTGTDTQKFFYGKLELQGLESGKYYLVAFDNGNAVPTTGTNGKTVYPRTCLVVQGEVGGLSMICQKGLRVSVYDLHEGTDGAEYVIPEGFEEADAHGLNVATNVATLVDSLTDFTTLQ